LTFGGGYENLATSAFERSRLMVRPTYPEPNRRVFPAELAYMSVDSEIRFRAKLLFGSLPGGVRELDFYKSGQGEWSETLKRQTYRESEVESLFSGATAWGLATPPFVGRGTYINTIGFRTFQHLPIGTEIDQIVKLMEGLTNGFRKIAPDTWKKGRTQLSDLELWRASAINEIKRIGEY
jgi:hypothetical protein